MCFFSSGVYNELQLLPYWNSAHCKPPYSQLVTSAHAHISKRYLPMQIVFLFSFHSALYLNIHMQTRNLTAGEIVSQVLHSKRLLSDFPSSPLSSIQTTIAPPPAAEEEEEEEEEDNDTRTLSNIVFMVITYTLVT